MKILSLKLDDEIFNETEEITGKLQLARNRYINEAVNIYNRVNKRRLLKNQLTKESAMTSKESMDILHEFEKLLDENLDTVQAIMVSNLSDNIVFIIKRDNVKLTLDKAMEYFMDMEEYEKCAEIRDLDILIQNLENEATNIKVSKSNQRKLKVNR